VGNGASSAFAALLDKVPRGERVRVIEALEAVAKVVDQNQH
jgi:antitoxin (DNA-binding transcriptional repressor) of toxin-antitoxin stability system